MDKLVLRADERAVLGKAVKKLRAQGKLPVVAYGHGFDPQPLEVDAKEAGKVYHAAGSSKIISLKVGDGRARNALIKDAQSDPRTGALLHADLYLVRMDEEMTAEVPLHFVGETELVFVQEGTLVKGLESAEVKCLPGDLPDNFEVDISVLDEFDKTITLADLKMPEGVKLVAEEPEGILVAKVEPPRSDEELAELDAELVEELPEGVAEETEGEAEEGEDKPSE
jgi:large subunit ribosomal protein L25